jgi:hypothetical protein
MILISLFSKTFATIGTAVLMISTPILGLLSPSHPAPLPTPVVSTSTEVQTAVQDKAVPVHEASTTIASSSAKIPVAAPTTPKKVKKPDMPVAIPVVSVKPPQNVPIVATPPIATTTVATSTPNIVIGTTTLAVASVPLLSGGIAHAGQTVPVSYLQITNTGKEYALLKGFRVIESGSAPTDAVISLSAVDDRGGSRGSVGGAGGTAPFNNGSALVPTNMVLAPGQMRLFTIKATLSGNVASYLGTALTLEVASIDSTALANGLFPILGTTWTIAE